MSPDITSVLLLLSVRMAVTAGFVLIATITAERAGPLLGGLVATLPVSAGPTYAFLALDHTAQFVADGALATLAINGVNAIFLLVYVRLAQRRSLSISLAAALVIWLMLTTASMRLAWSLASACAWNLAAFATCLVLVHRFRLVASPSVKASIHALGLRALAVAVLVGIVVGLSAQIGPTGSGVLAVVPVVLISVIVIVHRRLGGPATAAVMANAALGLVGFSIAVVVLRVAAIPLGSGVALLLALLASLTWGVSVYAVRRAGVQL